jgi:hypothetical protein
MGIRREYEVGILMSTDTDMKPALEAVAALTGTQGTRAEVAAWSVPGSHSRRLAISSRNLYCHWVGQDIYWRVADRRDYST